VISGHHSNGRFLPFFDQKFLIDLVPFLNVYGAMSVTFISRYLTPVNGASHLMESARHYTNLKN
jgi:hypothetical protein